MNEHTVVPLHNGKLLSCEGKWIMKLTGKWMEPETIIASEVTQAQKEKDGMFSHMWSPASNLFFSVFFMKHKWKSVEPKGVNILWRENAWGKEV